MDKTNQSQPINPNTQNNQTQSQQADQNQPRPAPEEGQPHTLNEVIPLDPSLLGYLKKSDDRPKHQVIESIVKPEITRSIENKTEKS